MKKIRKVGRTQPREAVDFYKENPELFKKLQNGETIEVPDDVFGRLKGVTETVEDREELVKSFSKSKKDKTSSKTMSSDYIEANRVEPDIVIKHEGHLSTGVLGSKYMIDALTMENRADIAWLLATATGYPSWSDMVAKYTTMCEFWTLKQSHNHVFTGSIDAWFYKALAGIRPDENQPAYKSIIIKPFIPENLPFARASLETIAGTVASGWQKQDNQLILDIEIPFNSSATVYLPVAEGTKVQINGQPLKVVENVKYERYEQKHQVYNIISGRYQFSWKF